MKSLKINSLKRYKDNSETYIQIFLKLLLNLTLKRHYSKMKQKVEKF